jgi:hypothetical protein
MGVALLSHALTLLLTRKTNARNFLHMGSHAVGIITDAKCRAEEDVGFIQVQTLALHIQNACGMAQAAILG